MQPLRTEITRAIGRSNCNLCHVGPRISEALPPRLRSGQSFACSGRNRLALVLGNGRKDMDCEPISFRHVGCDEIDAAFDQTGNERHVAGETVQFGNNEHRLALPAQVKRREELRPILPPAAFDFLVAGDYLSAHTGDESRDSRLLRL